MPEAFAFHDAVRAVPDADARDVIDRVLVDAEDAFPEYVNVPDAILSALADAGYSVVPTGDTEHVVRFTDEGWTIKHPLSCRDHLFDCEVHAAAVALIDGPPAEGTGDYRITLDEDGISLSRLPEEASVPLTEREAEGRELLAQAVGLLDGAVVRDENALAVWDEWDDRARAFLRTGETET